MDEERAIKNLRHEIIHGQTPMYIENPTHNSEIIVETLVEALARTTYPKFIESLGYNKEKLNFINQILQDTYGYPEAGMLLNIAKQQYTEKFDDIVNVNC